MINEEKVKQLYKVALYEQEAEKKYQQINKYYRNDYIVKEELKSIFTGTMTYLFMLMLWMASDWNAILQHISQTEFVQWGIPLVLVYIVFMIAYMILTYTIYKSKHNESSVRAKRYEAELMHLQEIYELEE